MAEAKKPETPEGGQRWMLFVLLMFLFYYLSQVVMQPPLPQISYSAFMQQLQTDQIGSVVIKGSEIRGRSQSRATDTRAAFDFVLTVPDMESDHLLRLLEKHNVDIQVQSDSMPFWARVLMGFVPWLLIIGLFMWSSRTLQSRMGGGAGGGLYSFGRSRARRFSDTSKGPAFDEIAGLESAKADLQEVIGYLKNPSKYDELGAHMPKGILMMGSPGTGKTMLAKATAHEAGVPFYSVSGSEFIEMFVGVGASRVRDMFERARKDAPALIFIDEIDSVGRVRGTGMGGGNDEREQTLNQVLAEMDGFDPQEAIVVMAATNRPDVLDPALLRPGRFDRKITLELPQRQARFEILQVHCRHKPLDSDVDLDAVAGMTPGFSGADLANLINEAALSAARHQRHSINQEDLLYSRDKVIMGSPRADLLNPSERKRIACHEAGHAITAYFSQFSDPVQKVSIVPRGQSLGMTEQLPLEDRHNLNEDFLHDRLSILLGGMCAERLIFGTISTGASDDLKQATKLAYKMAGQWGMGRNTGPVGYSVSEEHPFLGRELTEPRQFSEKTASLLDDETRHLLKEAEAATLDILQQHSEHLQSLLAALLEKETLYHDEIEQILGAAPEHHDVNI